jgi:hypothetical protein
VAAPNNNAIGVSWNVPMFSGFAVTSKVRETIALEDKARNDLEATKRAASQNARQAYLGMNSGLAQVKALEAAEVSSKSSLDSNKLGYQVGVRINIDVLNAQKLLYSTQKRPVESPLRHDHERPAPEVGCRHAEAKPTWSRSTTSWPSKHRPAGCLLRFITFNKTRR